MILHCFVCFSNETCLSRVCFQSLINQRWPLSRMLFVGIRWFEDLSLIFYSNSMLDSGTVILSYPCRAGLSRHLEYAPFDFVPTVTLWLR